MCGLAIQGDDRATETLSELDLLSHWNPHADRHSRGGARWWGVDIGYGGEPLLIPINMRDWSLLCVGRGNEV